MRSTFYGLEIARKGLFASQKAIDVTGHNITNANTVGYTRQRLVTKSIPAPAMTGLYRTNEKGQVGGGVDIQSLDQIRDNFLDMQYRKEACYLGEWSSRNSAFQYIEDIFAISSDPKADPSINAALADLFNSIQEMSKNPESKEIRTLVRQDAIKVTESLHHYYDQLVQLQREQDTAVDLAVKEINDIVLQIGDLNSQIFKFEITGEKANDLRDQRNMLVDDLSQMINVNYYESSDGRFRIDICGMPLVDHVNVNLLEDRADKPNSVSDDKFNTVYWKDSGVKVPISGGEMKGYIDMRDGDTADNIGIPYFVNKLNDFTRALVTEFNNVHGQGYTLPHDANPSANGIPFFDLDKITAKDICVSDEILDSVYNVACSDEKINDEGPKNWGNNNNALNLISIRDRNDLPIVGNFENYFKELIAELAVETSHSSKMLEGQKILTGHLINQRLSVSGVALDEETTNLIIYQHAYSAAARTITAMDEALDILINRTGLVGR